MHYGLYHGSSKWLTCFIHFLEHGNQVLAQSYGYSSSTSMLYLAFLMAIPSCAGT
jgi:hypothetical protein